MSLTSPAPSVRPSFLSFGYLPIGIAKYDLPGRLFGNPNLIKRLQAPDLMAALDIRPSDSVLDFGCGSGYMTVEMAKLAAKATGIDVIPYVNSIRVPPSLTGRLEYIQTSGTRLPFVLSNRSSRLKTWLCSNEWPTRSSRAAWRHRPHSFSNRWDP